MENSTKKRKANWLEDEEAFVYDLYESNKDVLDSTLTNTVTNKAKTDIWKSIAEELQNAFPGFGRTDEEIREKVCKLKSGARKKLMEMKKEQHQTGGGPSTVKMDRISSRIIESNKGAPSFYGIKGGIDSASSNVYSPAISVASLRSHSSQPNSASNTPLNCGKRNFGQNRSTLLVSKAPSYSSNFVKNDQSILLKKQLKKPCSNALVIKLGQPEVDVKTAHLELLKLEKEQIALKKAKLEAQLDLFRTMNNYYLRKMEKL